MHVYAIVPVAPYEPESQITESIKCLKELTCDNFTLDIYYVIETVPGDKRTLHWELPDNFTVMLRDTNRGYRAGKINDALDVIKNAGHNADYVALLDVDHRPAKDYITKCVAALEKNDAAVSSGCFHFVTNKTNALTKVVAMEHEFMDDLYRLLSRFDSFLAFAGTGVIKGTFLDNEKIDEEALLDDVDLTTRAYLKGKIAVLANTTLGDQAPVTFEDLYYQRVRWYRGLLESFSRYLTPMVKAPIPLSRKLSWFFIVIVPFFVYLAAPFGILYLGDIKKLSNSALEFVKIFLGSVAYMWLMTAFGIVAMVKHSTSKQFEWVPSVRSDV
jgi:cellulose synthase/poly-beta-1,6-N-acetylglucosamine synthase-like glycosyltransferase